jgi:hypothetical protein
MIKVSLVKAKELAHEMRRANRNEKMKPLDVKATIPAEAAQAESDRQAIRDKNELVQAEINQIGDHDVACDSYEIAQLNGALAKLDQ